MKSRFDDEGMFWHDLQEQRKRGKGERKAAATPPPIPDTGWHAPKEFPNLSGENWLAIDTETRDPNLKVSGPGWARGDGEVVGVSIATMDRRVWYFPFGHTVAPEQNLQCEHVLAWLKDTLEGRPRCFIGAHLKYDIGWLFAEGIQVAIKYLYDVQNAEPLLDEYASSYSLDVLGHKYLERGKLSNDMYEWCSLAYGGAATARAQGGNIYRAPPCLVGPYAEEDALMPVDIFAKQRPLLVQQGLDDVFMLETRLVPLLIDMQRRGVQVDLARANAINDEWLRNEERAQEQLNKIASMPVDVWAAASVATAFDRADVPYPTLASGSPSFTQHFLEHCEHEIAKYVLNVRRYSKNRGTFVQGYILDKHHNGKLYAQFNQLRRVTDEEGGYGAVSGRFSSSDPNLQNIPIRDEEIGPVVRSMFVPFDGDKGWRRYDYSQIEYRLLAHYAKGKGAKEAREAYRLDPTTDYHEWVRQEIYRITDMLLERKPTKNINFGLAYGMGRPKLRNVLGLSKERADKLFDAYHKGVPFAQRTFNTVMNRALAKGYIHTLLGRRARFDLWEPVDWRLRKAVKPLRDQKEMVELVNHHREIERENGNEVPRPGVQRAFGHKALNRLLQGGAADVAKKAMVDQYEAGVYDATGLPLLTVHDELDFSDPGTQESEEGFTEAKHIMETCVDLRVPLVADCEMGPNWGEVQ